MVAPAEVAPTTQNQGSTALARIDVSANLMTLASSGDSSLKFITDMGKTLAESRMLKLKNPQQGAAVILASICEGITPFQLMKEYHIMDDGGMSMKADVMLAKFNAAGGKHQWVKTGEDGEEAVLRLMWAGQDIQSVYHIDDAKRAKLIRAGGNWEKNPGEMLRARATSKGVRMVMPGIVAGIYCPEDFSENDIPPAEFVKTRQTRTTTKTAAAADPDVIDVTAEPSTNGAAEDVPFESGIAAASTDETTYAERDKVYMEIELLLTEIGKTKADIEANMQKKKPGATIDGLSLEAAQNLLTTLRAAAAKKRESQAA